MQEIKRQFILASGSPRRKELLRGCFINFIIRVSDIDEDISEQSAEKLVMKLACEKAQAIVNSSVEEKILVLGADTVVVIGNEILGKPANRDEARIMLKKLSGKEHLVMTGVALNDREKSISFVEKTKVVFNDIDSDLLELYLQTGESLDKAGSYGIQGLALSFIKSIDGSYSNVVGLPVDRCLYEIKRILGADKDKSGKWRDQFY